MNILQTPRNTMLRARAGLVLDQPFFASLLLRLAVFEDVTCETMYTDGKRLGYNPKFIESLSLDEVKGFVAHEVMHIASAHQVRRGERESSEWNAACDYAINSLIEDDGFKLPKDRLRSAEFDGKSAEEIYRAIYHKKPDSQNQGQQPQQGQGSGQSSASQQQQGQGQDGDQDQQGASGGQQPSADPGKCGEVRDVTAEDGGQASQADLSQNEAEWKIAVAQAAQQAKAMGKLPAGMERFVEALLEPKVDWREVLRRFVTQTSKQDYKWFPPNRRFLHYGLYLPSIQGDSLPPIVVAVDTSGSIDNEILQQFSAELSAIVAELPITSVKVVYCDAKVNRTEEFTKEDLPLKLKACGGGGTDFRPVVKHIESENSDAPACCIYLTDMEGTYPDDSPEYPVLWASIGHCSEAPFGEVVKI
jgi:predicted metal-dependent peptidase